MERIDGSKLTGYDETTGKKTPFTNYLVTGKDTDRTDFIVQATYKYPRILPGLLIGIIGGLIVAIVREILEQRRERDRIR